MTESYFLIYVKKRKYYRKKRIKCCLCSLLYQHLSTQNKLNKSNNGRRNRESQQA